MNNKYIKSLFLGLLTLTFSAGVAQEISLEEIVSKADMTRNGDLMSVNIDFSFPDFKLKSSQAVTIVPMIVNQQDTLVLPGVGVYGRTRWYQAQRFGEMPLSGPGETSLRYKKNLGNVDYSQVVSYQPWMNGSTLVLEKTDYGCASCPDGEVATEDVASFTEINYIPAFRFQEAVAEQIKARELSGRAYVDFPVNKIVIYPDYRNNTYELGKIIATIDSVKNDPDITVTSIHIAGTASPEGPYDNNVYLAKNRTIALKDYVTNLYSFPKDFIQTDYEPVDWKGLREWLENNNINHKAEILAIVNSDIEPFARNSKIKKDFPTEYDWLLKNVYPALRHSDYRIEYTIRQFTEIEEIREAIRTAPQKLSLNEMYTLAGALEPGSDEYNEVFEIAVRMYPNDETANLNAANSAMSRNDLVNAEKYLSKAGNSANAVYARGVLQAVKGNYAEALKLMEQAKSMGLNDIDEVINTLRQLSKYK